MRLHTLFAAEINIPARKLSEEAAKRPGSLSKGELADFVSYPDIAKRCISDAVKACEACIDCKCLVPGGGGRTPTTLRSADFESFRDAPKQLINNELFR